MKSKLRNVASAMLLAALAASALSGCRGGGTSTATYGVNAYRFVFGLNSFDGNPSFNCDGCSKVKKEIAERPGYFVFWDHRTKAYFAASLAEIRDKYGLTTDTAYHHESGMDWRRAMQQGEMLFGSERVTSLGDGRYQGVTTGMTYEDGAQTKDVELLAAESEEQKFFHRASSLSVRFEMSMDGAVKLALLGQKVESALRDRNGELTAADQAALTGEALGMVGVSMADIAKAAAESAVGKDDSSNAIVEKVAHELGTSPATIRDGILPELIGIQL